MHRALSLAALLAILAAPRVAAPQAPSILAVFDVEAKGIRLAPDVRDRLSDYLASRLAETGRFQVVPRDQLKARLVQKKAESYKQCFDQSCQIELGQELAAQKTLATQAMKLGSQCMVTLTIFDLSRAATEGGASGSGPCTEDGIVAALDVAVGKLTGAAAPKGTAKPAPVAAGPASVAPASAAPAAPEVDDAGPRVKRSAVTVAVGDLTVQAKTPSGQPVRLEVTDPSGKVTVTGSPFKEPRAQVGPWRVVAKARDHEALERTVQVPPDEVTLEKIELKPLGGLKIEGEPAGSAVQVTGPGGFKDEGGLPWEAEGLGSGTYRVTVSRAGYATDTRDVPVEPGRTATVAIRLQKGDASRPGPAAAGDGSDLVAVPGVGIGGLVLGRSTPEDVLRKYGRDCKINRDAAGEITEIDYDYEDETKYTPARTANHRRPCDFYFKNRRLSRMNFDVYQKELTTRGGIKNSSSLSDVLRTFGQPDQERKGTTLDKWSYREGIDIWVYPESKGARVNSFDLVPAW